MGKYSRKTLLSCGLFLMTFFILTGLTYAWIDRSLEYSNSFELKSGESAAIVEGAVYVNPVNYTLDQPVENAYHKQNGILKNASKATEPDSEGIFLITYNQTLLPSFSILDAIDSEYTAVSALFPTYTIEIKVFKEMYDSYLKASLHYVGIPDSKANYINLSDKYFFQYRYLSVSNSPDELLYSGIQKAQESSYLEKQKQAFFDSNSIQNSTSIALFTSEDYQGAPIDPTKTPDQQCYIPSFAYAKNGQLLFSKSILIEISLNPLAFLSVYRQDPEAFQKSFQFGMTFEVHLSLSNVPFYLDEQKGSLI